MTKTIKAKTVGSYQNLHILPAVHHEIEMQHYEYDKGVRFLVSNNLNIAITFLSE